MFKDGKHLTLRPFEPDEWPILSNWFYDEDYREFFRDVSMTLNVQQLAAYANMPNAMAYVVRLNTEFNGKPIGSTVGFVMLYDISWVSATAKVGILIDKEFQGKTFCMESIYILADYAFNKLRLRKLILEILKSNERLQKIVEFGAFKKEATLKREAMINNKPVDVIRYALFEKEGKQRVKQYEESLCYQ